MPNKLAQSGDRALDHGFVVVLGPHFVRSETTRMRWFGADADALRQLEGGRRPRASSAKDWVNNQRPPVAGGCFRSECFGDIF